MAYLYTFLQSNLLEVAYLAWALKQSHRPLQILLFITFMNSLTHPWVFFGFMTMESSYYVNIVSAEVFAISLETFLISSFLKLPLMRSFLLSSIANLISWQLGPVLTWLIFYS